MRSCCDLSSVQLIRIRQERLEVGRTVINKKKTWKASVDLGKGERRKNRARKYPFSFVLHPLSHSKKLGSLTNLAEVQEHTHTLRHTTKQLYVLVGLRKLTYLSIYLHRLFLPPFFS